MAEQIEINGLTDDGLTLTLGDVTALAPRALLAREMADVTADGAAEWAAALSHDLAEAITALGKGQQPRAPFDALVLQRT